MEINEKRLKNVLKQLLKEAIEDEDNIKFKPTVEWMNKYYNKANSELFDNKLGHCDFDVRSLGVRTLGRFSVTGTNLKVNQRTRRMFKENLFGVDYIDSDNFVMLCKPKIEMNINYSGTQKVLYCTLVHEMCHYYTYKDGFCPIQGHGVEFRSIAQSVSLNSNGEINIQRLATAEEMGGRTLDDEIQKKLDAKKARNIDRSNYIIVIPQQSSQCKLLNTTDADLINKVIKVNSAFKVIQVVNKEISNEIYNKGYKTKMRTPKYGYKYWILNKNDEIIQNVLSDDSNYKLLNDPDTKLIAEKNNIKEKIISITPDMNLSKYSPLEIV